MSTKVLIDANLYLRDIYSAGDKNAENTLTELLKLKEHIFVTEQIVNEVRRNALNCVIRSCEDQRVHNLAVQAKLSSTEDKELAEASRTANDALEAFKRKLDEFLVQRIRTTSQGTDPFTKRLEVIFQSAKKPSDEQLTLARLRKETGCPPGKQDDPLGDQIIWEQFLDEVKGSTVLLASCDGDYFTKCKSGTFLNLFLMVELMAKGVDHAGVFVFDSLKDLLAFAEAKGLANVSAKSISYPPGQYSPHLYLSSNDVASCPICGGAILVQHAQMRTPEGIMFGPICVNGHRVPTEYWD